jgi:hypothetical protein
MFSMVILLFGFFAGEKHEKLSPMYSRKSLLGSRDLARSVRWLHPARLVDGAWRCQRRWMLA